MNRPASERMEEIRKQVEGLCANGGKDCFCHMLECQRCELQDNFEIEAFDHVCFLLAEIEKRDEALRKLAEAAEELAKMADKLGTIDIGGKNMHQTFKTPLGHVAMKVLNVIREIMGKERGE